MAQRRISIQSAGREAVCGLLAAVLIVASPLPVLADEKPVGTTTQAATETSVTAPASAQPATPSPAAAPAATPTPAPTSASPQSEAAVPSVPATAAPNNPSQSATPLTPTGSEPATTAKVVNGVESKATSGDATVTKNETAGNATSGNATTSATVLNVANANGSDAGSFKTFNCDITRDVQDNIVIDPATLMPLPECTNGGVVNGVPLQQSTSTAGLQSGSSLVNILNDILLSANSGGALVDANGTAGNATSGDALALANIVNIANSSITSRNSFLGVINIYSQLKGDILVPQSFVDSLVRGSGGRSQSGTTNINTTINASAASGDATVAGNKEGGNATSGDTMTSLTVINLTGQDIVAKNSLLVFVNVLGKWMGMVVPAAAGNGNTTAMLGGGLQGSSSASNPSASPATNTLQSNTAITNNITVQAKSGDSAVTNNDQGGDATSGRAAAGVNLLNITDSNFWLQDWFGALFINVLGSWMGDFDIQANAPESPTTGVTAPQPQVQDVKVYRFTEPSVVTPTAPTTVSRNVQADVPADDNPVAADITAEIIPAGKVLGANTYQDEASLDSIRGSGSADSLAMAAVVMATGLLAVVSVAIIRRHLAA